MNMMPRKITKKKVKKKYIKKKQKKRKKTRKHKKKIYSIYDNLIQCSAKSHIFFWIMVCIPKLHCRLHCSLHCRISSYIVGYNVGFNVGCSYNVAYNVGCRTTLQRHCRLTTTQIWSRMQPTLQDGGLHCRIIILFYQK